MGNRYGTDAGVQSNADARPDPAILVTEGVLTWLRRRGESLLPQPCPPDPARCVRWWLDHMQEPERQSETYPAAVLGQDAKRWEEGYAQRCRNALLRFLDMAPAERSAVCAGVLQDRVPYRGDAFPVYMRIHEETLRMREQGIESYRRAASEAATSFVADVA